MVEQGFGIAIEHASNNARQPFGNSVAEQTVKFFRRTALVSQMPRADHELLDFSLFDLARRVKASRAMLFEGDRPVSIKPVLSIVRDHA
ncbi:hypothetical protein [Bradyrhizobium sp. AZCC 2289]|uniref:hypothetical protein n=1 Tax=Bradyrhizobium sp. AZCC 2289 TaxID=3117026 RepID=UPI002FF25ABF